MRTILLLVISILILKTSISQNENSVFISSYGESSESTILAINKYLDGKNPNDYLVIFDFYSFSERKGQKKLTRDGYRGINNCFRHDSLLNAIESNSIGIQNALQLVDKIRFTKEKEYSYSSLTYFKNVCKIDLTRYSFKKLTFADTIIGEFSNKFLLTISDSLILDNFLYDRKLSKLDLIEKMKIQTKKKIIFLTQYPIGTFRKKEWKKELENYRKLKKRFINLGYETISVISSFGDKRSLNSRGLNILLQFNNKSLIGRNEITFDDLPKKVFIYTKTKFKKCFFQFDRLIIFPDVSYCR